MSEDDKFKVFAAFVIIAALALAVALFAAVVQWIAGAFGVHLSFEQALAINVGLTILISVLRMGK